MVVLSSVVPVMFGTGLPRATSDPPPPAFRKTIATTATVVATATPRRARIGRVGRRGAELTAPASAADGQLPGHRGMDGALELVRPGLEGMDRIVGRLRSGDDR